MSNTEKKSLVLCFLTEDQGRDVEMLLPLIYYAERFLNCKVEFAFAWEVHKVYIRRPQVVLLPNTVGNFLYFQISKYAFQQGIKVFSLISEGNYRTDGSFNYWGCNREDGRFYQDYLCLWSQRAYDFLLEEIPQFKHQIVLTGAPGFDRYAIYDFMDKKAYCEFKGLKPFKKVMGYAAWGFGKLSNELGRKELLFFFRNDESRLAWAEKQMYLVEDILKKMIEANPDILFILKKHPKQTHEHLTKDGINEISRLQHYPNVIYISQNEDIHHIISACDIWMGFESTTAMETWLMDSDKPTIFITPDPDFNRTQIYRGCVSVKNYSELQDITDEYYRTGTVAAFQDASKKLNRKRLISESVGFGDGFNHIRTAYYLEKTLNRKSPSATPKLSFKYFMWYHLLHLGKYFYHKKVFLMLPKFKKTIWIFERWRLNNLKVLQKKYAPYLDRFYEKHQIGPRLKAGTLYRDLLPWSEPAPSQE